MTVVFFSCIRFFMMTITITQSEREVLLKVFPRQTIYKWLHIGVTPKRGTRRLVEELIGRDPWENHQAKDGIPA